MRFAQNEIVLPEVKQLLELDHFKENITTLKMYLATLKKLSTVGIFSLQIFQELLLNHQVTEGWGTYQGRKSEDIVDNPEILELLKSNDHQEIINTLTLIRSTIAYTPVVALIKAIELYSQADIQITSVQIVPADDVFTKSKLQISFFDDSVNYASDEQANNPVVSAKVRYKRRLRNGSFNFDGSSQTIAVKQKDNYETCIEASLYFSNPTHTRFIAEVTLERKSGEKVVREFSFNEKA
jgi:hypothetical protein